ncbi:DNA repair protein rad18 [Macroventuria anomochaeta]|uniref:DNA repair protein rad18 n=1 Tax=Macroventuria anomochaeta TaxID=301207 RepID=A0ACB6RYI6_9PLEO|nr:DNA repair protein rad18 [Macroventuria anomochaeta]KAF2626777.1 DNA repair protein rad18 [Macroventuria anomochaeta]
METTFDLPDSTDWIATALPAFEPLEAALRCEMCKEFYMNPVITSCSHTFCSLCIRRSIAADGKCPSCRTTLSSDKLAPNIAVREVVMRFQEARPKALELARADKEQETGIEAGNNKKRKLEDTDLEDGEDVRQTRSRQTRRTRRNAGSSDAPVEIADSGDDGDGDFLPEGIAKCPICNEAMKQELVFNHLDVCTGQSASQGRSTRSKTKNPFPGALQRRQKEPSPPPARQSQLNYAMMKEGALRKKLQEIGIPSWGSKDLMKRRHIEWLNIHNSNCDADESVRKRKKQLVKELEEWENTQGGRADTKESKVMRKDFDGSGYAKSHKSDFDDLIAQARKQRAAPKSEDDKETNGNADGVAQKDPHPHPESLLSMPDTPISTEQKPQSIRQNGVEPQGLYNHGSELGTRQDGAEFANHAEANSTSEPVESTTASQEPPIGLQNPLGSPSRKLPMFSMPEEPVKELDMFAT